MPDFSSISRLGSVNGVQYNANAAAGNYERENSNFLKLFSGEVLTVFNRETIFKDLTMRRSISSGKSASFPIRVASQVVITGQVTGSLVKVTKA